MYGQKRLGSRVLSVALLACAILLGAAGVGSGGAPANAAMKTSAQPAPAQSSSTAPREKIYVLHVYYRSIAERDPLANEFGAAEVGTQDGYLTFWTDQATYSEFLKRGLRVEVDNEETARINATNFFDSNSPDTFYGGYKTVEEMQTYLDQEVAATIPRWPRR